MAATATLPASRANSTAMLSHAESLALSDALACGGSFTAAAAIGARTSLGARASLGARTSLGKAPLADLKPSGPQGACKPFTLVDDGTGAWTKGDFKLPGGAEHAFVLGDADLAELEAAVAASEAAGAPLVALRGPAGAAAAGFALPALGPKLAAAAKAHVMGGRGFLLVRGIGRSAFLSTDERKIRAFLGLSAACGFNAGPQRKDGALLHHVAATSTLKGADDKQCNHGESTLATPLDFHCDGQADAVALMCLRQAPIGGESSWASAAAVHNEMLRRGYYEEVTTLMRRGCWFRNKARYADVPAGEAPFHDMPVFDFTGGHFACHMAGHQYDEVFDKYGAAWGLGAKSDAQRRAEAAFCAIAGELALRARLEPGDVQIIDNARVLHARSAFVDGDAPHKKRHLVRLWCLYPELEEGARPLPGHLRFPRSYDGVDAPAAAGRAPGGLMRHADASAFFVPLAPKGRAPQ